MTDLFLLSPAQMRKIEPFFPRSHGIARVDDLRVVSGIIYVLERDLQWKNAPTALGLIRRIIIASVAGLNEVLSTGFSAIWQQVIGRPAR